MKKFFVLFASLSALLTSCNQKAAEALMPEATGGQYDLYLIMPDELKETPLNDSLHAIFEYPMECTPNGDDYFLVSTISPEHFKRQIMTLGNVVKISIDPQAGSSPRVYMEHDKYARGQLYVKMIASNAQDLADYIMPLQEGLRNVFVKAEMARAMKKMQKDGALEQQDRLMKVQNVHMCIPYTIKKPGRSNVDDKSFFWVTDDYMNKQSHLVVYSVPYTNENIFSLEGAVAVRDSVMKANIVGGTPDSYMTTNKKVVLPEYKALNVNGKYVGELRGMWRMENGLMAGPFVCHIRLDEVNNRVVFAEGFCYAPSEGKRKLIRNLEASLYTLQLPSDNMTSVDFTPGEEELSAPLQ